MLSNTAVPKYYGIFRDAVNRGEVPVCREILMQMQRIESMIQNPEYYYDDTAIDSFIAFCEQEMVLSDGSRLHMLFSYKLWAEDLLSWYKYVDSEVWVPDGNGGGTYQVRRVKRRVRKKQYLIVARGAAKSLYAACIQFYILVMDTATTKQVTCAPTMLQAEEVIAPIKTALVKAPGPIIQMLTEGSLQNTTGNKMNRQKLAHTKKGIENFVTGSILEVRPMSVAKLQGLGTKVATIDEWLSCDIKEDVAGALQQGCGKVKNYLIVAISSEGTVRSGVGDSIKMELDSILRGDYPAPETSIWHYRLDNINEVGEPSMWVKANPNIGITVSYEEYQMDVERAENAPSARNDILAKRFGIPTEGYTYFFTYEETIHMPPRSYDGCQCSLGIDLSLGDDFCSFTFLFPFSDGSYGVKTRNYISEYSYGLLPEATKLRYQGFIQEDSLCVMAGTILDMMEVYEDIDNYIQKHNYDVCSVGYDPYNAKEFIERWCTENGSWAVEKVPQGARTESVPLGEIKKLTEQRMIYFDQDLFSFAMEHCITLEDTNGNRKLLKKRREEKIDAVAAMLDAYVAWRLNRESF